MNDVRLSLERSLRAPRKARRAVGDWLAGKSCPDGVREDVLLVVSELVTNAVVHAHSNALVVGSFVDGTLRIEVHDDDPSPPVLSPVADADGGFGLRLVAALTDAWGWALTESGKQVWTETRYERPTAGSP